MRTSVVTFSLMSCLILFGCGEGDPTTATLDPAVETQSDELLGFGAVVPAKELLITDLSVVEDPIRTVYQRGGGIRGAWSFGRLMENLADGGDVSAFTLNWLAQWERDQVINGFTSPARPTIRDSITEPWRQASGCKPGNARCTLDFTKAPFRLTAIVNRMDKRDMPDRLGRVTDAGEGRFVFVALGPTGTPLTATAIFEYQLPARHQLEVTLWAISWHLLGQLPFGPVYNAVLQGITESFSGRNSAPGRPNDSALKFLRTDEVSLAAAGTDPSNLPSTKLWELRSFIIGSNGQLQQTTVAQTPSLKLNGTPALAKWVSANAAAILAGKAELPAEWLDAASPNPADLFWIAPGATSEPALREFALNTCSGCHRSETDTVGFLHLGKRNPGEQVAVSDWLAKTDLPRRKADFERLLRVNDQISLAGDTSEMRVGRGH